MADSLAEPDSHQTSQPSPFTSNTTQDVPSPSSSSAEQPPTTEASTTTTTTTSTTPNPDLRARFKALQARAKASASQNLKETRAESRRLATDPAALAKIERQQAAAAHDLARADADAAGEDFERRRAWDWTVDEAEAWDRRQADKARRRADVAFRDYNQDAAKVHERQIRGLERDGAGGRFDVDAYAAHKAEGVRRAAESGSLMLVEDPEGGGGLVAVDRHGTFGQAEAAGFEARSRPSKEGVDRLVHNLKKAEEQRLKNRKKRKIRDDEDGRDVTYINEKNKQFNMKLDRSYNKYTTDIRESFERGTTI